MIALRDRSSYAGTTIQIGSLAPLLGAGWASADALYYTESATATGSLGGSAFSNSLITLTLIGDTSTVTSPSSGFFEELGPISINIASLGVTANLTDVGLVFVNQGAGAAGLADDSLGSILDTYDSAFGPYGLTTAIGPITNRNYINSSLGFGTDQGVFVINSAGNSTFTASLTPEPATTTLLGIALFGVGVLKRLAPVRAGCAPTPNPGS